MTYVITLENALKLKAAGCNGYAAKSYRYYTKNYKEVKKEGNLTVTKTWTEWDGDMTGVTLDDTSSQKSQLSDRFYDSWDDALAPAYNIVELAHLIATWDQAWAKRIEALTNPNDLIIHVLELAKK